MITPTTRATVSIVSFVVALGAMLPLSACAHRAPPETWDGAFATAGGRLTLGFDNEAETYVDVYLVTQQRQFQLGRVAPGAHRVLSIPAAALASNIGFVRLAVLAGAPMTLDAADDPRATFSILQPTAHLFGQRWTFYKTSLATPEVRGAPADPRRP